MSLSSVSGAFAALDPQSGEVGAVRHGRKKTRATIGDAARNGLTPGSAVSTAD